MSDTELNIGKGGHADLPSDINQLKSMVENLSIAEMNESNSVSKAQIYKQKEAVKAKLTNALAKAKRGYTKELFF